VIKSRSCFRQSSRSHIRRCLWNSEPDSHANSHSAFGQLFWFSGKCVFVQKVLKRIIRNTLGKGPLFGQMHHTRAAKLRITVSVFLSSLQLTALLLKSFRSASIVTPYTLPFRYGPSFISTTTSSMNCLGNWIPLRIRFRSRNTQPHLRFILPFRYGRKDQNESMA